MTEIPPTADPPGRPGRTLKRIASEALLVLLLACLALGVLWELGYPNFGWILFGIVGVCGPAAMEIGRAVRARR